MSTNSALGTYRFFVDSSVPNLKSLLPLLFNTCGAIYFLTTRPADPFRPKHKVPIYNIRSKRFSLLENICTLCVVTCLGEKKSC